MSTANQKKYDRKRQNLSQEFDRIIEQDDTQNEEGFKVLNSGIDELKRMESGLNEELENEDSEMKSLEEEIKTIEKECENMEIEIVKSEKALNQTQNE